MASDPDYWLLSYEELRLGHEVTDAEFIERIMPKEDGNGTAMEP